MVADAPTIRSLGVPVYLPSFLFGIGQGAVIPIVGLAAIDLGASVAIAGAIVALRGFGTMLFDLPAGMLVARLGEKRAMVAATLLLVVSLLGSAISSNAIQLAVSTFVMGCAWSVWLIARLSYVSDVMPVHMRGRALSVLGGVNRIGTFVGPFLGALAIGLSGLDGAFYVHIATAALGCIVLVVVPAQEMAGAEVDHVTAGSVGILSVARAHRRTFLTAGLATITIGILRASRQVVIPLWGDHIGLDAATVGVVFGISSAIDMTLFYPAGAASDRWGRKFVAVPCLAILSLGHVLLPLSDSLTTLIVVGLLLGFGNGLGSGIVMTLGADFAPERGRAEFLGAFRLLGDAGTAAGPLIVAVVTGLTTLGAAAMVIGVVGLGGAVCVGWWMPESLRRHDGAVPPRIRDTPQSVGPATPPSQSR